jgi:4-amino-4-deoxy-L-arabinose transferase-like glycosyltransferase
MGFGIFVQVFELHEFFGGDSLTYDENGAGWMNVWIGNGKPSLRLLYYNNPRSGAGWGMNYFTAAVYMVVGRSLFAAQSVCALIGASVAPMVFFCARNVYNNMRVAKLAAVGVAVFPALVIWSSLLLKDALLMFLLVATMTLVLQLQKKISYISLALLAGSLFAIFSLRFYVFYMLAVAVVGSFLVGFATSTASIIRGILILAVIGVGLTYFGVLQDASLNLETFGNLERLQDSRRDLAMRANSGFGQDLDVSTPEGALTALPLGIYVIMLAPFPWAAVNLRQAITIPDVLLWWSMLPFMVVGLIYTVRHRLRNAFPILVFTLLLTLAYALFQGNIGTAYRQRTQLQVFFSILIAVGMVVFKEHQENKAVERAASQRRIERHLVQHKTLADRS